jgi:excinuclease UvrABC ATPase subunit
MRTGPPAAPAEIVIEGAREHNLRNISLRIPKGQIVVFTGVSGSGKSSVVFSTIAVESQRQLNETFTSFIRNRLPRYEKPEADQIENLSPAIVVDQKPIGGNARSTVGTATDIYSIVRVLFSRIGRPSAGMATMYSFNTPEGACPKCEGLGRTVQPDLDRFFDTSKSLRSGALLFPLFNVGGPQWTMLTRAGLLDTGKALASYTDSEWRTLLYGVDASDPRAGTSTAYEGIIDRFTRLYLNRDLSSMSRRTRAAVETFTIYDTCPACHGDRLNQDALATRIDGRTIADYSNMDITDLVDVLAAIEHPLGTSLARQAVIGLRRLIDIGLGYLSLGRETPTLSGGEAQRLKMVRYLGSSLTGMTYIFDEPSVGLHPHDISRMNQLLLQLRDRGNTVLVVEHDRDVISIADHVIDMGPGAGSHGGRVVYQGPYPGLCQADTATGHALRCITELKDRLRKPDGAFTIANARRHNLKNITVDIPVGVLTVFTGVARSGKSTLVAEIIAQHPLAVVADQNGLSGSYRSTPASHLGIMDVIRSQFADANGMDAGYFSFNSKGACPNCGGKGHVTADMAFMDPVTTVCELCNGQRFDPKVLSYVLNGRNIVEILALTAEEAAALFTDRAIGQKVNTLVEVGLGYLTLGQPLDTLSGGERQRLKLAGELHKAGNIYVLDEPTSGLHSSDTQTLLKVLDRLVDAGNTVLVIEHHLDVVKHADWVIDLGPDGGKHGGQIIFQGTPVQLLQTKNSFTAEALRRELRHLPQSPEGSLPRRSVVKADTPSGRP